MFKETRVSEGRFWELDFARGAAVVAMVCLHAAFDFAYFRQGSFPGGEWRALAMATAAAFIFVSGVGLSIKHARERKAGVNPLPSMLARGTKIFCLGLLVTLATLQFLPQAAIYFGILHFMGVASVLAIPFLSRKNAALIAGVAAIAIGILLEGIIAQTPYFFWLGLKHAGLYTLDYFPIFPWVGVMLLGIFAGNVLYSGGARRFEAPKLEKSVFTRAVCLAGRRSLAIYFLHQPLLIAAILFLL